VLAPQLCIGGIWTGEGEVPWFILNHDEIGMMPLIEVYKPT
jgi:hypothetical protein